MDELLPLFPLNIVVYPGEKVNLHIFEPRYIELINDVYASDTFFGMPTYLKNNIEYGCTLKVVEISKIYDDGRMDIKTLGQDIFKILKFYNPTFGKKYAAAKVEFVQNIYDPDLFLNEKLHEMMLTLVNRLDTKSNLKLKEDFTAYDIAHFAGLSLEAKYEILKLNHEKDRQKYLFRHLKKLIPIAENIEQTRQRINMNGHFRNYDPLDF